MERYYDGSGEDDSSGDEQDTRFNIAPCTECQYYSPHDGKKLFGLKNCDLKNYHGPLWTKTEIVHSTARVIQLWWKYEVNDSCNKT